MYEATTGRVPFAGNNYLSVISQVLNEDPRPPRELRPELSDELEAIILRAMAKDKADRYAAATDLLRDVTALLGDPSRSTERAKITGPRRKLRRRSKSPLKIAVWVALVAVVVAAVVTTVVMLFGGTEGAQQRRDRVGRPAAPLIDAAPPAIEVDAAPEAETLEVTIQTEPPGATVTVDGIDKGPAPVTLRLVVHDHFTEIVASSPGYDDKKVTVNAYVDKGKLYTLPLKRSATGSPAPPLHRPAPSEPKPASPSNKTGGELNGNPFKNEPAPRP
jgi:plasmid stabilization system protein ParE